MELPRLSVIVPNYNHGKYLPACLRGILNQSAPPAEVIVIDDASTDNSMEVLTDFAARHPALRVLRNEKNQGAVFGMNRGIELAKHEYLAFLAADDEVKPGLFEQSLRLLALHPRAGLSCTISEWHDMSSGLSWFMGAGMADKPAYLAPAELVRLGQSGKLLIVSASAIFRKAALDEVGRFMPELRWHCDWFATFVPAFRYGLCYVPEPLSEFNLYPNSFYNRGRKTEEHTRVLTRLLDRLSSPECADIAPHIRESAALALFGLPVVRLLLQHRTYRKFFSPLLLHRATRRSFELVGKKLLPRPLARLALRMLYSR